MRVAQESHLPWARVLLAQQGCSVACQVVHSRTGLGLAGSYLNANAANDAASTPRRRHRFVQRRSQPMRQVSTSGRHDQLRLVAVQLRRQWQPGAGWVQP